MPPKKSKSETRAAKNAQYHGRMDNEEGAAIRVGQHGNNWQPLPISDFAKQNKLTIKWAGFWSVSESGKKVEGTDPTSGLTFILDSTRAYYRVQNSDGQYVDAQCRTKSQAPYNGDDNAFNAASHFKNSSK